MNTAPSPLVSVIIAFLNEERHLHEAVESVLQQDYTHWELLLVDDGSTDRSTGIAKEYSMRFPGKIFYFEHEGHINKGLSASRNYGISQAQGKFIAFLDADDVWLPGKLSNQISIFRRFPDVAMVAETSEYWYSWSEEQRDNVQIPVGASPDRVYEPPQLMEQLYPLGKGAAPCPSALILKKAAFVRSGGFEESFKKEYGLYEDQAFLSKIYLNEKVFVSSACNNLYRQRPESIVSRVHADGKYHIVRKYFLEWLERYLKKEQTGNKEVRKLLQKTLFPYRFPRLYFLTEKLPRRVKKFVGKLHKRVKKLVKTG